MQAIVSASILALNEKRSARANSGFDTYVEVAPSDRRFFTETLKNAANLHDHHITTVRTLETLAESVLVCCR